MPFARHPPSHCHVLQMFQQVFSTAVGSPVSVTVARAAYHQLAYPFSAAHANPTLDHSIVIISCILSPTGIIPYQPLLLPPLLFFITHPSCLATTLARYWLVNKRHAVTWTSCPLLSSRHDPLPSVCVCMSPCHVLF